MSGTHGRCLNFIMAGGGCCTWLFHIKQKYCIHQHAFLCSNIQHSTFHQTNYCSRPQTIRWFRQSDRKPVGLPFRLKNRRTFACFPFHSCQLNGLHCPGNSFSFLAVQKPIELCQLVNPHIHLRINDVNPPASYLLLTYHLPFMI